MNILDYAILAVLVLSVVWGIYKGFLPSVLNVCAFFVSWLSAYAFHPLMSNYIKTRTEFIPTVLYFAEGADRISSVELIRAPIESIPADKINEMILGARFPKSVEALLRENIVNNAFAKDGLSTLGDYFNYTLVYTLVNVMSFLIVFAIVALALYLVINLTDAVVRLPSLKQFDGLLGGCFGLLRGIFLVFVLFIIVPISVAIVPVDLNKYVTGSALAQFFYQTNFITDVLRGVI